MKVLKNTTIGSPGKLPELSRPHGYLSSQMSKRQLLHPVFTFGLIVSETRWIGGVQSHRFDYDAGTGGIGNQRVFVRVPKDEGIPDGMTVDAAGYVWSARWDGGSMTWRSAAPCCR